ncbi:MAG: polysaccharide deacetylase family protein [Candidatus Improbicoccus devescovinae]|nr:MAG: polysaccharide deacetylase family protein [Candidatus Improbicoccus devescovinae]
MNFLIITKKRIILISSLIFTACISILIGVNLTKSITNTNKKLPIYSVKKEEKLVSISFDAAWGNEHTPKILEVLKDFNIKATFFLVGDWVKKYPEDVKNINAQGHDVENHSNTHPNMTKISAEEMATQIQQCNSKIKEITGKEPTLFRPPFGAYNNELIEFLNNKKMHCIQWSIDSLDWKDRSATEMSRKITSKIKPGSIILFHNGGKHTVEAIKLIIPKIHEQGFKIVQISQLIIKENYKILHDGTQVPETKDSTQSPGVKE